MTSPLSRPATALAVASDTRDEPSLGDDKFESGCAPATAPAPAPVQSPAVWVGAGRARSDRRRVGVDRL